MIPIKNIYYMLSYAFQTLNRQQYKRLVAERFDNTAELCAAILTIGISSQLKRGLKKAYIPRTEALSTLRGKIDVTDSIKTQAILKQQMVCTYDEFSVNSYLNRIIKSTAVCLLRADISKSRKKELRRQLLFFEEVESLDLHTINWHIQYDRNNQTYQMLIAVCWLVVKGLLQRNEDGTVKIMHFLDEQRICRLYERFILAYYQREFPQLSASAARIPWQIDEGMDEYLPAMRSDVILSWKEKVLILDAKYYSHSMQMQHEKRTIHSANLYQIFTYVKNKEAQLGGQPHEVSGMLLYAKTDEETVPGSEYRMSGNRISVRTLDLNQDFPAIADQLNGIAADFFGMDIQPERTSA